MSPQELAISAFPFVIAILLLGGALLGSGLKPAVKRALEIFVVAPVLAASAAAVIALGVMRHDKVDFGFGVLFGGLAAFLVVSWFRNRRASGPS